MSPLVKSETTQHQQPTWWAVFEVVLNYKTWHSYIVNYSMASILTAWLLCLTVHGFPKMRCGVFF